MDELKMQYPTHNNEYVIKSFDDFEYNVVDLNDYTIWLIETFREITFRNVHFFGNLKKSLYNTERKIILLLPTQFKIRSTSDVKYGNVSEYLEEISNQVGEITGISFDLTYEEQEFKIDGSTYSSSFYFSEYEGVEHNYSTVLRTENGKKCLMLKYDNVYLTTLNLDEYGVKKIINSFLDRNKKVETPEWAKEYTICNKKELIKKQLEIKNNIKKLEDEKKEIRSEIELLDDYISILYLSDTPLSKKVIEILDIIFQIKENTFTDEGREDYEIETSDNVFLFEIKGTKKSLKKMHISQLYSHKAAYEDSHSENFTKNIKQVLIVNCEKDVPIAERKKIHTNIVDEAVRMEQVIIKTDDLLKIFENIDAISVGKLEEELVDQVGLISLDFLN